MIANFITTVQALAAAEREAGVKLVAAKQLQFIEQDKIKRQTDVEVAATARAASRSRDESRAKTEVAITNHGAVSGSFDGEGRISPRWR